jgi:hypothetical protein
VTVFSAEKESRMFGWFKKKSQPIGPDFSQIDSRKKAEKLFRTGVLWPGGGGA